MTPPCVHRLRYRDTKIDSGLRSLISRPTVPGQICRYRSISFHIDLQSIMGGARTTRIPKIYTSSNCIVVYDKCYGIRCMDSQCGIGRRLKRPWPENAAAAAVFSWDHRLNLVILCKTSWLGIDNTLLSPFSLLNPLAKHMWILLSCRYLGYQIQLTDT